MVARKVTAEYVGYFDRIEFIQPLPTGKIVREIYLRQNGEWVIRYDSTSVYHICPYDGRFISCEKCLADFDIEDEVDWCMSFEKRVSDVELAKRANICKGAGLEVKFIESTETIGKSI